MKVAHYRWFSPLVSLAFYSYTSERGIPTMVEHFRLIFALLIWPLHFLVPGRAALAQVLSTPAPAPSADTGLVMMIATFISQVKVNGFVAFVIQKLKESQTPALNWISTNTPGVTRMVAAVAAAGTAVGIHWTFTGQTLTITGLTLTGILTLAYNIGQNYLFQHAWYKQIFAPKPAAVIATPQNVVAPAVTTRGGAGVPGGD